MSDAYGKALTAYFNGDKKTRIKVESNVVETEYWNIKEFFHTWEQMSEIEHRALKLCEGRTLDVGAGSGSHTLWLQDKGMDVEAIDVSAGAVDVMKQRKRLQHSDKRMDQSSLREWGRGPRLCESFLLIPTDGHVSGGVSKSPEGSVFFFFLRLLCFIVFFFF